MLAEFSLCFHGNADLAVWRLGWARAVEHRTGFAVFLAEYRGLHVTRRIADLRQLPSSTHAPRTITFELRMRVDRRHVVFYGHSLGSAVAAELAEVHPPAALLLRVAIFIRPCHGETDRLPARSSGLACDFAHPL